ncbi:hypothetical protein [Vibrio thalassae]|uniref:hypothetical protein n=1 Tax=Vibrio thalassae TaxID=1243014 RepID=UPI0013050D02|nr:hypothetical protein [Vibrio thalassae]
MGTELTEKQSQLISLLGSKTNLKRIIKTMPEPHYSKLRKVMLEAISDTDSERAEAELQKQHNIALIESAVTQLREQGVPSELIAQQLSSTT